MYFKGQIASVWTGLVGAQSRFPLLQWKIGNYGSCRGVMPGLRVSILWFSIYPDVE
jgi:hypothetical protein